MKHENISYHNEIIKLDDIIASLENRLILPLINYLYKRVENKKGT